MTAGHLPRVTSQEIVGEDVDPTGFFESLDIRWPDASRMCSSRKLLGVCLRNLEVDDRLTGPRDRCNAFKCVTYQSSCICLPQRPWTAEGPAAIPFGASLRLCSCDAPHGPTGSGMASLVEGLVNSAFDPQHRQPTTTDHWSKMHVEGPNT